MLPARLACESWHRGFFSLSAQGGVAVSHYSGHRCTASGSARRAHARRGRRDAQHLEASRPARRLMSRLALSTRTQDLIVLEMLTAAGSYSRTPPPHVVGPRRREETLAARAKCALHGGREFLVHLLELLGRRGANTVAGLRGVGPKL